MLPFEFPAFFVVLLAQCPTVHITFAMLPMGRRFLFHTWFAQAYAQTGITNDPSAGSPTETLLRLVLPLNDQV